MLKWTDYHHDGLGFKKMTLAERIVKNKRDREYRRMWAAVLFVVWLVLTGAAVLYAVIHGFVWVLLKMKGVI